MSRIAYVNGAYVPMSDAYVHIEDRGYQFADGVYEGITVASGKLIDLEPHLDRLERSLRELQIAMPMGRRAMTFVFKETVRRNRLANAFLYIQVTRGVAKRDHPFPANSSSTLVVTARRLDLAAVKSRASIGINVSSQPDIRWGRCDVKSISLLPNILAKQAAREAGGFEAVMYDKDGYVTEGSSTNIWMVTKDGTLVTRSTDDNILPGITRATLMQMAKDLQMQVETRAFKVEEAKSAAEMFLTSSTSCTMPIVKFDDTVIGGGTPGPAATRLAEAYWAYIEG